ncbi:proteasome subunit alpha type-1 isoform X1 [Mustela lutreola]|uniref:proteasome subunit alpha type-1 isoform X1 n=1 Tax=Mustela lutreola TaxID=9666 RepID=UPI00279727AF|nr:proteasome subunit alpha type-1 isoform X1 [Mustela lutreola]
MFRNQYDNDVTVWSPQGRIHQIEYAMEAVKQGSATVGLKSKTHAVLVALKRAQSELAAHQKKILHVDNHIGISIAGLTADARLLCNFMRQECLDSRFVFDRPLPVSRLVSLIGSKTQIPTQRYGRRPYGVGLLIAGYDDMGPHIFQTCPSANYFDCRAMSIGARSQSARTYLERHMSGFMECNLNELVKHGLRALRETLPAEQDLTTKVDNMFFNSRFQHYRMSPLELLVKTWSSRFMMMMMYLHSWKVLKKDRRERHSLLNLLMNLQKRLMNQWNIKLQASLCVYYQICKNSGTCTDDSNLYFEPKDAGWSYGMF